ncbi:MAG: tetratricopeptide repeat protein [Dongiaceae bacterium]
MAAITLCSLLLFTGYETPAKSDLIGLTTQAAAGFEEGATAYKRGDYSAAYQEWQVWADKGDAKSQFGMAALFAAGLGVPVDPHKAADWCLKAAEQGLPVAEYQLGAEYTLGRGVNQSDAEAAKWYRRSAEHGFAWAQYRLGVYYMNGRGVPQDYNEAERWYLEAAEQQVASAMHNLGWMYEKGKGVRKDATQAAKWYQSAADLGHGGSQHNIGLFYAKGYGVPKDVKKAYFWQSLALKHSDSDKLKRFAEEEKSMAMRHMNASEIAQADHDVSNWIPKGPNPNCSQLHDLGFLYFSEC